MQHDIVNKFSTHLKNVLTKALCFAAEQDNSTVEPEHLLWALGSEKGSIGCELLKKAGVKTGKLRNLVNENDAAETTTDAPQLSRQAKRVIEKAVLAASQYNHRYIGTEHLLSGLLEINHDVTQAFFQQHLDMTQLREQLTVVLQSTSKFPELTETVDRYQQHDDLLSPSPLVPNTGTHASESSNTPALDYFGTELTTEEQQERIDPVIGREAELERVMEILCRRTKNNPLLLGEPGVGKTAIVEGFAKRIVEEDVPPALQNKRVISLDFASILAGTMYRGEFEGRLKQIIEEAKENEEIILFIDEIHTMSGAGASSGSVDAANILKPALARGEIRCIGSTTPAEYKKEIETDGALERRFQTIEVREPSVKETEEIIRQVIPNYEAFHRTSITEDAVRHAIRLAARFIPEKRFPDKALDVLDEASASKRVQAKTTSTTDDRRARKSRLKQLRHEKEKAVHDERFLDAIELKKHEATLRRALNDATGRAETPVHTVTKSDIIRVIARLKNLPLEDLEEEGRQERLLELESALETRVLGQKNVVKNVAGALRRAKAGITDPNRPLSSFLFLGPSGVGKTELAKTIAKTVFLDEDALIRLDMSEFSEGFTMSKLIGAPAGYVGYREAAKLTDRVKRRPYSVVLFDEIEKAHADVQNILLQIMEEGEVTDATGRVVSFSNTVVIMTSNVGLERFEQAGIGFASDDVEKRQRLEDDLTQELKERFRPELLNRIDHTCIFRPLSGTTLAQIIEKQLVELGERMKQQREIGLEVRDEVIAHLLEQIDPKLGARDIRRIIQNTVETAIADRLLRGKRKPQRLAIKLRRGKIKAVQARN